MKQYSAVTNRCLFISSLSLSLSFVLPLQLLVLTASDLVTSALRVIVSRLIKSYQIVGTVHTARTLVLKYNFIAVKFIVKVNKNGK